MAGPSFVKIDPQQIPRDANGRCLVDLYVYLPTSARYVRFVMAGDIFDDDRTVQLNRHVQNDLFVAEGTTAVPEQSLTIKGDGPAADGKMVFKADRALNPDQLEVLPANAAPPEEFKKEVIGKAVEEDLKKVFTSFLDPDQDPSKVLGAIESHADGIISVIAPETKDLKGHLIKNVKYLMIMNDVSAISALAILIALANGYDSKKTFRDLAYACLVMDAGLAEFPPEEIEAYYRDPTTLAPDTVMKIRKHPIRSHELAVTKLKSLTDVTLQLILGHHELYNGKGYPRGVRYESLFPMVKVLSLAVDIFESMKRASLRNESIPLGEVIISFREPSIEPHLKRHSKKLVEGVITYLNLEVAAPAEPLKA